MNIINLPTAEKHVADFLAAESALDIIGLESSIKKRFHQTAQTLLKQIAK